MRARAGWAPLYEEVGMVLLLAWTAAQVLIVAFLTVRAVVEA